MILPVGVIGAGREVQDRLSGAGFRFCFIGGVALLRWGEPRFTQDVDLTLLCPFGQEVAVAGDIAKLLTPRMPGAVEFASESRVFLARTSDGTPVDIAFGAIDFELRCVERASPFDFGGGVSLTTCGAEDLVVMKVFADRGQDWVDVEAIVLRRAGELDWRLIEAELEPLLEVRGGKSSWERLIGLRRGG
jgi:hypothetical protein